MGGVCSRDGTRAAPRGAILDAQTYKPVEKPWGAGAVSDAHLPLDPESDVGGAATAPSGEKQTLQMDSYSLLLVRLITIWNDGPSDCSHCLKLLHGLILYVLNLGLQATIASFLLLSAFRLEAELSKEKFSAKYNMTIPRAGQYMRDAVDAGNPQVPASFNAPEGGIFQLCVQQLDVRYPIFYYIMCFIWAMVMLSEFQDILMNWAAHLLKVPRRTNAAAPLLETVGSRTVIHHLDSWMVYFLVMVMCVPRGLIAVTITFGGAKYLAMQTSAFALVIKAMCMRFVINLDELILGSLSTVSARKKLGNTEMQTTFVPSARTGCWESGVGGMVYVGVAVGFVLFIMLGVEGDIMHFRADCHAYDAKFGVPGAPSKMGFTDMWSRLLEGAF